jgi:7-cyano-7-deazaguanine synthase in queuosine biosynthesis
MSKNTDIVLMSSGGMESVLILHELPKERLRVLIFDCWGDSNEVPFAIKQAETYGVPYDVIDLSWFNKLIDEESPEKYIPGFQLVMTGAALGYAESVGSEVVANGNIRYSVKGYRNNKLYLPKAPERKIIDDLSEGLLLIEELYEKLYSNRVHLWFPLLGLDKIEVVKRLKLHGIKDEFHCSCVDRDKKKKEFSHCGICFNCTVRREAYSLAGEKDNTVYYFEEFNPERYRV